jgi:hypothetical protein
MKSSATTSPIQNQIQFENIKKWKNGRNAICRHDSNSISMESKHLYHKTIESRDGKKVKRRLNHTLKKKDLSCFYFLNFILSMCSIHWTQCPESSTYRREDIVDVHCCMKRNFVGVCVFLHKFLKFSIEY